MADENIVTNIVANADFSGLIADVNKVTASLSKLQSQLIASDAKLANQVAVMNRSFSENLRRTGQFSTHFVTLTSDTEKFGKSLDGGKLKLRDYFRTFQEHTKTSGGIIRDLAKQQVALQNAIIQPLGKNAQGLMQFNVQVPQGLDNIKNKTAIARQELQILNKVVQDGGVQLINWGKNTQWAGRQLTVGLTVPLAAFGKAAADAFRMADAELTRLTKVYGGVAATSATELSKIRNEVSSTAAELSKGYGVSFKETIALAADIAATGKTGNELLSSVKETSRLAVLGEVDRQEAMKATLAIQSTFKQNTEQLSESINFLNAVENQTVVSIEDLTIAIPKAGPVVKQLGGSVEDLAFFMTAMKEGGINASEGANALKSGLASMINPSKKAAGFLADLGINIKGLVEANAGNLKGTVIGFAKALDTLDPLNRARAIEQMFGKFQFARLSTLFQNVTKDSSQAARALGLAGASVEELAILSERELGKVEDAVGVKFQKSIEQLKLELIPIGKTFLQALTPVVEFLGKILAKFNNFSDGTKKAFAIVIGVVGGLAPVALMTFGLFMNAIANGIKLFAALRSGMAKLNGQNNVLGGGFDYLTQQEIEQLAQTNALHTSHQQLISTFNVESGAVNALAAAYANAASQARTLAASSPGLFNTVPGPVGAVAGLPPVQKFAKGGVVPGTGNKDSVASMLTPGEAVIPAPVAQDPQFQPIIDAMVNGKLQGFIFMIYMEIVRKKKLI